ncbi:hypothetical protein YT1_0356 [Rhodococcus ruber]|nr:hypothetical protein YT1_0356 [Rhodococcus ruber]
MRRRSAARLRARAESDFFFAKACAFRLAGVVVESPRS